MSLVGKTIEYLCVGDIKREAVIDSVEYHEGLGKDVYSCVSPYGNYFRLTRNEFTIKEEKVNV